MDMDFDIRAFYKLSYTLCFGYYGHAGSIKVPSLLAYARSLANFLGKIYNKKGLTLPEGSAWTKLFYI